MKKNIAKLFFDSKSAKKPLVLLTAYDALNARLLVKSGIDILLVGDSVATVLLGYKRTVDVTMDEMIHHCRAVRRGAGKSAFIIGDMPLKGYEQGVRQAVGNARRFVTEGGCDAVKLEWTPQAPLLTDELIKRKIPVMGHVGLTPQSFGKNQKFKVQGTHALSAKKIIDQALEFEKRGAFSLVLECVPDRLSRWLTRHLSIPVIGIGAGRFCDGQVLVFQDLAGLSEGMKLKFVRRYENLSGKIQKALSCFIYDVRRGRFPDDSETFHMSDDEWEKLCSHLKHP